MVFFGTMSNATPPNPPGEDVSGVTDIHIGKVVKPHAAIAGRTKFYVERYFPTEPGQRFLLFCDLYKGKIDLYQGIMLSPNSNLPRYVEGVIKLQGAKSEKRLRYFFDFLQHKEKEIAADAFREFEIANYSDLRAMAKDLPPEKLIAWLKDPRTGAAHRGLYAVLLGHCSKDRKRDADLLRSLDGPALAGGPAIADLLIGQTLLQPEAGWERVRGILSDPRNEFMQRYSAVRCLRFFVEKCPDVVPRKELIEGAALLLDQEDIADIAVEYLRQWKCWEMTGRVLALADSEKHQNPITPRAVVRFALCSPTESARRYVTKLRQADPDMVKYMEESLQLEQEAKQAPAPK